MYTWRLTNTYAHKEVEREEWASETVDRKNRERKSEIEEKERKDVCMIFFFAKEQTE